MTPSEFVPTSLSERLRLSLTRPDRSSFLVIGRPGSGKSALLSILTHQLREEHQLVLHISLREVESVDGLVVVIIRRLSRELKTLAAENPGVANPDLDATLNEISDLNARFERSPKFDAPEVLRRVFELFAAAMPFKRQPTLILDGLDETREPSSIALLIERLMRGKQLAIRIVLASRLTPETNRLQQTNFFETLTVGSLTVEDSHNLLNRLVEPDQLTPTLAARIVSLAEGNPLLLRIFASTLRSSGKLLDLQTPTNELIAQYVESATERVITISGMGDDARLVLKLLGLFEFVSISSLAELSGLTSDRVQAIVDAAVGVSLVSSGNDIVIFAHKSLAESVRTSVLKEKIDFANLQFGDEAAERDTLLEASFVPRVDLQQIFFGDKTIVLGDRGAGKSAIFKELQRAPVPTKSGQQSVAMVASSQAPATFLQQVTPGSPEVSSAERFKASWLLYAAVLAAREVHQYVGKTTRGERRYAREARTLLRQIGRTDWIRGEARFSRWWATLRSVLPAKVKFSVGPVSVEPNWTDDRRGSGAGGQVEIVKFLEQTDEMLNLLQRRLLVVFDQIDEAYKYQREVQESLVQGLLLAESSLAQKKWIRLIVLLRTDLFEIYDIQEKNKFVSRTIRLNWTWQDLASLLLSRLYSNTQCHQILVELGRDSSADNNLQLRIGFPSEVEGVPFSQWLLEGLRNGNNKVSPRQIILFLNLARDSVAESPGRPPIPLFTEAEVIRALDRISEHSYQEVISDFRVATAFVRNCRAGKITTFDLPEVVSLFDKSEGTVALQVERLERLGFLERLVVREGDELATRFRIPPLFTRGWDANIK